MEIMKKSISINALFYRYFLTVLAMILLSGVSLFAVMEFSIQSGLVLPANYQEQTLLYYQQHPKDFFPDQLQGQFAYAVFENDVLVENHLDYSLEEATRYFKEKIPATSGYFMEVTKEDKTYVIHYQLEMRYQNSWLNQYFPSADVLFYPVFIGMCLGGFILVTVVFARKIRRSLQPLHLITRQVSNQDLDFSVEKTSLKEVNDVLDSLEQMRDSLSASLQEKWRIEQEKTHQIASLTHDLKTPLTIIKGNNELLQLSDVSPKQREYVYQSTKNIAKMEHYLQQLTGIMSNQTEKYFLNPMQLKEWMVFLVDESKEIAKSYERTVTIVYPEDTSGIVHVNKEDMSRVVINLLSNAVEYGDQQAPIEIVFKREE